MGPERVGLDNRSKRCLKKEKEKNEKHAENCQRIIQFYLRFDLIFDSFCYKSISSFFLHKE